MFAELHFYPGADFNIIKSAPFPAYAEGCIPAHPDYVLCEIEHDSCSVIAERVSWFLENDHLPFKILLYD